MNKILIIDGNNTMYRAYHSYRNLTNSAKPVSIIYGMPNLVNALINQFKPDDVYICWDGVQRSQHRVKLCPTYKDGRKTMTQEERIAMIKQKGEVMNIFYALGIKQIYHQEMEADDWIYMLTKKLRKENNVTIVSTDKDFHQLIGTNVKVYNTALRMLIHAKNTKNKFGYSPENCVDYLCLTGDKSDNIKGIRGIGPAKAAGLLQEFSSIKNFLKSDKSFASINKEQLEGVYKTNRQMIDLALFYKKFLKGKVKLVYVNNDATPKFRKKALFRICATYQIRTFKKKQFLKNFR